MEHLRSMGSWLAIYLMGLSFFIAASIFALFSAFNADNIKSTLHEEGTYGKVVPTALSVAKDEAAKKGAGLNQLPVGEQWVQDAAVRAFPAEDVETKTNALIDGTFNWLEGDTTKPEFQLDFTENKQRFSDEVGAYAENRLTSLPRCNLNNMPRTTNIDVYSLECLPFGASPAALSAQVKQQILGSEEFMQDTVISSDDIKFENAGQDPFQQLEGARTLYENRGLLMWGLLIIAVVLAAAGYYLASNRKLALKRMYLSFLVSAILLVVVYFVLGYLFNNIVANVAVDQVSKDVVLPVFQSLADQARTIYLIFAGVAAAIAAGLYLLHRRMS